ncbi:MAG: hypothetical protein ACKOAD_07285 [Gammaproteobacteria bacterium]
MKIGLLTKNPNAYTVQKLIQAGEGLGHEMVLINTAFCYLSINSERHTIYSTAHEELNHLDLVIPLISPKNIVYGTAILRQFEMLGTKVLNHASAIQTVQDKFKLFQLLARKKINLAIIAFADIPQEAEKLIDLVDGPPLIIRLLNSYHHRSAILTKNYQEAISVINAFQQIQANILIQKYTKPEDNKIIRCLILDNKILASIEISDLKKLNRPIQLKPKLKKLGLAAMQALKLKLGMIDLCTDPQHGPIILDVHTNINLRLIEKICENNLAPTIIELALAQI